MKNLAVFLGLAAVVAALLIVGATLDPARALPPPTIPAPAQAEVLEPNVRVYRVLPYRDGTRLVCLVVVSERTQGMAAGKSVAVACDEG